MPLNKIEAKKEALNEFYWDQRYLLAETGWDIGAVSTPHKTYIDQLSNKTLRILIPGAGNSYEAIYLAEKGFTDITIVDISGVLVKELQAKISKKYPAIKIIHSDFFQHEGVYDLILEQTFFCALEPIFRPNYVVHIKKLLSDNGKLVGLLFQKSFDKNPPFGGDINAYRQLFAKAFRTKVLETCYNSIPARAGSELFMIFEK